jgi:hypothetical protein
MTRMSKISKNKLIEAARHCKETICAGEICPLFNEESCVELFKSFVAELEKEDEPKPTYKDVLLEKFPKVNMDVFLKYVNPQHVFGCDVWTNWNDEYKEREADE